MAPSSSNAGLSPDAAIRASLLLFPLLFSRPVVIDYTWSTVITRPSQSLLVSKLNSPLPRKPVVGGGDQGADIFGGPILPPQMAWCDTARTQARGLRKR